MNNAAETFLRAFYVADPTNGLLGWDAFNDAANKEQLRNQAAHALAAVLSVTHADINTLLAEAAMYRSSYLGYDGTVLDDDADTTRMYELADRLDDLAEKLAPFCVPPLAEFEQECADCDDGTAYGYACNSCRGTMLWPPTRDGERVRLLPSPPSLDQPTPAEA